MTDLTKTPERIAGMFDAIAGQYDFLNPLLSAGIDRRWRRAAIRSLQLTGRERVLDLCTGTADLAIAAADARPGAADVLGVDFAGAMPRVGLQKTRRRTEGAPITLVRGDAMRIPVPDASVDAVTVSFGIRNVQDTAAACVAGVGCKESMATAPVTIRPRGLVQYARPPSAPAPAQMRSPIQEPRPMRKAGRAPRSMAVRTMSTFTTPSSMLMEKASAAPRRKSSTGAITTR